ncbi:unnamed protein product, partial [Arabidopsis halleri]
METTPETQSKTHQSGSHRLPAGREDWWSEDATATLIDNVATVHASDLHHHASNSESSLPPRFQTAHLENRDSETIPSDSRRFRFRFRFRSEKRSSTGDSMLLRGQVTPSLIYVT